jgi:hypothetical protein
MNSRIALAGSTAIAVFALTAGSAAAKTATYAGTAEIGGSVALDVKMNKKGKAAKRILEVRAVDVPGTCETSGPGIPLNATVPLDLKVSKSGAFTFEFTDSYGNTSSLDGQFKGRKDKRVAGEFRYAAHFPAEGEYPEEDCATDLSAYSALKGAPETPPPGRATR